MIAARSASVMNAHGCKTRQSALRFCRPGGNTFLGDEERAVLPVTTLRELEAVAYQLSNLQASGKPD
ncbi:MAG: hypothetical protein FWG56_08700 [Desulfovibrionaceae bacterium]|nr:hypothetical protein [Desulfovibrionaceae bacterium]